jgi:TPR repeat protein
MSSPAQCAPKQSDAITYPMGAMLRGVQGRFLVQFTLMPDGTTRIPHVVFGMRAPAFGVAIRAGILKTKFPPLAPGAHPILCTLDLQFMEGQYSLDDYPHLQRELWRAHRNAGTGDPAAETLYGTLLAGLPQLHRHADRAQFLPWLLKGAQGGDSLAQYEVALCLESTFGGCVPDEGKALRWLHLAAAQNEPDAEVSLAVHALRGGPDAAHLTAARRWLEQAVAQGNVAAEAYLSALLAASPQAALRDPARALRLESNAYEGVWFDPSGYEIRAAAYAAEGHFAYAAMVERRAIVEARDLGWTLAPLQRRLARYESQKPWYGNLLSYARGTERPQVHPASKSGG